MCRRLVCGIMDGLISTISRVTTTLPRRYISPLWGVEAYTASSVPWSISWRIPTRAEVMFEGRSICCSSPPKTLTCSRQTQDLTLTPTYVTHDRLPQPIALHPEAIKTRPDDVGTSRLDSEEIWLKPKKKKSSTFVIASVEDTPSLRRSITHQEPPRLIVSRAEEIGTP